MEEAVEAVEEGEEEDESNTPYQQASSDGTVFLRSTQCAIS